MKQVLNENRVIRNILCVIVSGVIGIPQIYVVYGSGFSMLTTWILLFWILVSPFVVMMVSRKISEAFRALDKLKELEAKELKSEMQDILGKK